MPGTTTLALQSTTSLLNDEGESDFPGLSSIEASRLEPIRQAWQPTWALAEASTGFSRGQMSMAFVFTTQKEFVILPQLRTRAQALTITPTITEAIVGTALVDAFFASLPPPLNAAPHGSIGAVFLGTLPAPNYISNPVNGPFQVNSSGQVVQQSTANLTFIACLPAIDASAPCVIYQHGITRTKFDSLAVANSNAGVGMGTIAIDLVLHGDNSLPGQPSGTDFINLENLRMSLANLLQSSANLSALTRMVSSGNTDFSGVATPEFSTTSIEFSGQSLGSIVGDLFMATENNVPTAMLNVPGGRITDLLVNSPSFAPEINAGLAALGIVPGSPAYTQFFFIAQTFVDDGDPFNYGPHILPGSLAGNRPASVLMQEMVGDQVVPNSATTDLARAINNNTGNFPNLDTLMSISGLTQLGTPHFGSGLFQYQNGSHGFLIDPTAGPTVAAQTQMVTYLVSALFGTPTIANFGQGALPAPPVGGVKFTIDVDAAIRLPGER